MGQVSRSVPLEDLLRALRVSHSAGETLGNPYVRLDADLVTEVIRLLTPASETQPSNSDKLPSNGAIAHTYGKLKAALTELLRLYDWRNELGRIERDFNHDKKQMTTWLNKYALLERAEGRDA